MKQHLPVLSLLALSLLFLGCPLRTWVLLNTPEGLSNVDKPVYDYLALQKLDIEQIGKAAKEINEEEEIEALYNSAREISNSLIDDITKKIKNREEVTTDIFSEKIARSDSLRIELRQKWNSTVSGAGTLRIPDPSGFIVSILANLATQVALRNYIKLFKDEFTVSPLSEL